MEHILEKKVSKVSNYHQDLLNEELINKILQTHKIQYTEGKYMMCGPQGFMDQAKEILKANGITRDKIKLEAFTINFVTSSDSKDLTSKVTIYEQKKKHTIDMSRDKTILQAAMAENIMLPYSCRSGMCSSCRARCVSGEVKMIDGHLLSDEEVSNGEILTCVSFPVSNNVSISYLND